MSDDVPLPDLLAARLGSTAPVVTDQDPLQTPGLDEKIHRVEIGGPASNQDVRLALSVNVLTALLEVAVRSSSQRAVVFGAGFKLTRYRCRGHVYQTMTILGRKPVPEVSTFIGFQEEPGEEDVFKEEVIVPPGFDPGEKLGEQVLGGPHTDLRLFLSVSLLNHMIGRARASRTKRAVVHNAGLVIDTYRTPTGAIYQIVTVAGRQPVPEDPAVLLARS
jgi:hypothetical protein